MGLWDGGDASLLYTQRLQNGTVAPKDLWVTDMVLLHNLNKVTFIFRMTPDKLWVSQRIYKVLPYSLHLAPLFVQFTHLKKYFY